MHSKCLVSLTEENARRNRVWRPEAADETEASNVLAERRRREKMNHRFSVLGSLLPSTGVKADKVYLLDRTIEYLQELERRVGELESSREKPMLNKRKKICAIQEDESRVSVSITEKKVSVEIRCPWKKDLLIEVMGAARNLQLDFYSVRSANINGILSLNIGSKLKSSTETSAKMITEALEGVIGKCWHT